MTVARMRREMSAGEYLLWTRYFSRREAEREIAAAKAG